MASPPSSINAATALHKKRILPHIRQTRSYGREQESAGKICGLVLAKEEQLARTSGAKARKLEKEVKKLQSQANRAIDKAEELNGRFAELVTGVILPKRLEDGRGRNGLTVDDWKGYFREYKYADCVESTSFTNAVLNEDETIDSPHAVGILLTKTGLFSRRLLLSYARGTGFGKKLQDFPEAKHQKIRKSLANSFGLDHMFNIVDLREDIAKAVFNGKGIYYADRELNDLAGSTIIDAWLREQRNVFPGDEALQIYDEDHGKVKSLRCVICHPNHDLASLLLL